MQFTLPEPKNFPQAAKGLSMRELKVIKNNLMKSLSELFIDSQNKIGGGIGFEVRPYFKEARIIIDAHEEGAIKIIDKKMNALKKLFSGISITIDVAGKITKI